MNKILAVIAVVLTALFVTADEVKIPAIYTVKGELDKANGHMQGMAVSDNAIYVSHKDGIFKIDRKSGKCIAHVNTPCHTGDICYRDGRIYAAVVYYDKVRYGKGSLRVYDENLKELSKYEHDYPSDGITVLGDHIYFGVGPSPQKMHDVNYIARIRKDFSEKPEIFEINYGNPTHFGVQTMCSDGKYIYANFYGAGRKPKCLVVLTPDMKVINTDTFSGSIGLDTVSVPEYPNEKIFIATRAIYKYRKKEQPRLRFDFFRYINGKMVNITKR